MMMKWQLDPRPRAPVLRVGAALPDPPFEFMTKNGAAGFDTALMKRIAEILGREWQLIPYEGSDFNGIFAGLDDDRYDCVASGTTVTPGRQKIADFCAPYLTSGQSLVVDVTRRPNVHGVADLNGLVIGVQQGNTSQPVADSLVSAHRAAGVRVYAYDQIEKALDDLTSGCCDAFMKLAPVTAWFARDRPGLRVVETGPQQVLAVGADGNDGRGEFARLVPQENERTERSLGTEERNNE